MFEDLDRIKIFLSLVDAQAPLYDYRKYLNISKNDVKFHLKLISKYREMAGPHTILKEKNKTKDVADVPVESFKYSWPTMEIIDKCLVIVATQRGGNIYFDSTEIDTGRGKKSIGEFKNFQYPVEVKTRNENGSGINFGKWNRCIRENPQYKYYMLLHDDCFEFQFGWLQKMVEVYESDNKAGAVCHQIYGPGATHAKFMEYYCESLTSVALGIMDFVYDELSKVFSNPKFISVMGGEQVLISYKVMGEIQNLGGIPERTSALLGGVWERIFSGYITSLGYKILDCRVGGKLPFKHHYIE